VPPSAADESCQQCGQTIKQSEQAFISGDRILCAVCYGALTIDAPSMQTAVVPLRNDVGLAHRSGSTARLFDLNIEQILENWEVYHGLRELIANAIDEQVISGSQPIDIYKDSGGDWHIRDYGRGLKIEHLTLNESREKLEIEAGIIGKFGVGLKDALATLHRHGVMVSIESSHGIFKLKPATKHGFDAVVTLHVEYEEPSESFQGTDIKLSGVCDTDIAQARNLFLKFNSETVLEDTSFGQIIQRSGNVGRIYVNGVLAAEEPNFLFAYNITSLTPAMRKKLNRERVNVTRSLYSDRVKSILKSANAKAVRNVLADQALLDNSRRGDEMFWLEIAALASNCLHERQPVCFVTNLEYTANVDLVQQMPASGLQVVFVDSAVKQKLLEQMHDGGSQVQTLESFVNVYNDSFKFLFVDPAALTIEERFVFDLTGRLFELVDVAPMHRPPVRISETMRETADTLRLWLPQSREIVIKRCQLAAPHLYARTLLHEVAHATSGTLDCTRDFESVLSAYLGKAAATALR
jgi:hypothetical protein